MKLKKTMRAAAAFVLASLLAFPAAGLTARAQAGSVVLSGDDTRAALQCDSDLFAGFKDLEPGQTVSQEIDAVNNDTQTMEFYLRAENADVSDFTSSGACALSEELLGQYRLTLSETDASGAARVLYDGPLSGAGNAGGGSMTSDISLGALKTGAAAKLTATLSVPASLGNRYRNAQAKIRWVFGAQGGGTQTETKVPIPYTGGAAPGAPTALLGAGAACFAAFAAVLGACLRGRRRRAGGFRRAENRFSA